MAAGSSVGFVADLGEGGLKRIVGLLVTDETDSVILAVQEGALKDLLTLEVGDVTISLARVKRVDTVTDLSGWTKAVQPPVIKAQALLKAYYRSDIDPRAVDTDSMASAHSQAAQKPRFQMRGPNGEEGDDEDDEGDDYMKRFASTFKQHWGKDQSDVGVRDLRAMFGSVGDSSTLPGTKTPLGQTDQGPAPWMAPQWSDPKGDPGYQHHQQRFRGHRPSSSGDRVSGTAGFPGAPRGAPWGPPNLPPGMDTNSMMMMFMMDQFRRQEQHGSQESGGKAFKKVHSMRKKCELMPEKVVSTYLDDCMDRLGAEPGDLWQPHQVSAKINWGNMAGLHRCHYHLSHILAISLRGDHKQAEAYIVQLCRCLHQVALDSGTWATGALLLPKPDPLFKQTTGGTEEELEAIIAYQEAMKRLKKTDGKFENGKDVKDIKKGE